MEVSKFVFSVEKEERRSRLDDVVIKRLCAILAKTDPDADVSRTKVRRMIADGTVSINGRPVHTATLTVKSEDRISVFLDRERFFKEKKPADIAFEMDESRILFEDEWLVVVDKPAGLPTEGTVVASRDSLHSALLRFLAKRDGAAGEPYAAMHHRLDRETSGAILFAKRKEANAALHLAFENHEVIKTYEALCAKPPRGSRPAGSEFSVCNTMGRISAKSARAKWGAVDTGGQEARTGFRVLAETPLGMHVQAMPATGRTHQIRVHLAGAGMPILGDELYGGPTDIKGRAVPRVMLHAARLRLKHPVSGAALDIRSPVPEDFRALLSYLKKGSE